MSVDHEDRQIVTVPRWVMLECGGDARDAMVLAQLTWWMQPAQRDGSPRTRQIVNRDGHQWMHTTDAVLAEELGMSESQVGRARRSLRSQGLIDYKAAKVEGAKVTLVRPTITGSDDSVGSTPDPTTSQDGSPTTSQDQLSDDSVGSRARATPPVEPRQEKPEEPRGTGVLDQPPYDPFDFFGQFWSVYPRKVGKPSAKRAWVRALRRASPGRIIAGAEVYARLRRGQDPQFTAHPATWLNDDRWDTPAETGPTLSQATRAALDYAERHKHEATPPRRQIG